MTRRSFSLTLMLGLLLASLAPLAAGAQPAGRELEQTSFDLATVTLELETVLDGFESPVDVTNAGDGSDRLFISERAGVVWIAVDGEVLPEPFLDISDVVRDEDGEQGFFGIVFHPDYEQNGHFFASYTKEPDGANVVARFRVSPDDPNRSDPARLVELISLPDRLPNHNGGDLAFDANGYLYIGTGDEGGYGDPVDPFDNPQNAQSLYGKMLRVDPSLSVDAVSGDAYTIPPDNPFVDDPDVRDEIWAFGLRNPYRFSIDPATGDIYIGDVGEAMWEEINFEPGDSPGGRNYGWPIMEGKGCFPRNVTDCDRGGLTLPVLEYQHVQAPGEPDSCSSVTGGRVYRGEAAPQMQGVYIFGDWCDGRIWGAYQDASGEWRMHELLDTFINMTAFGEGESGELYLTDMLGGSIARLRFVPSQAGSAFERTWARTDQPVANGAVARTWVWGPAPTTPLMTEPYSDAPGGERAVQYYDKARMEVTNPSDDPGSPWYVTNGLLVTELMTGRLQRGDAEFETREPAEINVAGDMDDPDGVTYATLAGLRNAEPHEEDVLIATLLEPDGSIRQSPALVDYDVTAGPLATETNHRTASVFWDFMTSSGPVIEGGQRVEAALFESAYYATGLPVTEAYWTTIDVGGTEKLVLLQCFERRCLTYTPDNPAGWRVEAGNVGLHYHAWRYGE
jgi:glucose/arabinose dehydrogenase